MSRIRGEALAERSAADPGRSASAAPSVEATCPKCGAPRAAEACPKCGLVYEKWRGSRRAATTDSLETERLWREALRDFAEPRRHATFIARCVHSGELPFAVARYAEVARSSDPERARIARERLRQAAALFEVFSMPPSPREQSRGALRRLLRLAGRLAVVVIFACCTLAVSGALLVRKSRSHGVDSQELLPPATLRVASPASATTRPGGYSAAPTPQYPPAGRGIDLGT